MCRPLTRREMLRYAGLVAATPLLPELARPVKAYAATEARAVPMHLELVTLTESTAVLTWFTGDPTKPDQYGRPEPLPADTVFELGTHPLRLERVVAWHDGTAYHYVELSGLDPRRTYYYRAISNGRSAIPTAVPGAVGPTPTARTTTSCAATTIAPTTDRRTPRAHPRKRTRAIATA